VASAFVRETGSRFAPEEPLRLELASFVECVRAHRTPVVAGGGQRALDLALEITRQIRALNRYRSHDGPSFMVIAGEPSGDALAAQLVTELRQVLAHPPFARAWGPGAASGGGGPSRSTSS